MTVDSSKPQKRLWSVAFYLFLAALFAFSYWYFLIKPKQWFDPQMQQPPVLAQADQQAQLRQLLIRHFPKLRQDSDWFIRFRQPRCGCERFVELYHQSFEKNAPKTMQVRTLNLESDRFNQAEKTWLKKWINSTPSIALFHSSGEILYFGPYHQEGICNDENSYLEPVLNALQKGEPISVLNTLVYGCFCAIDS